MNLNFLPNVTGARGKLSRPVAQHREALCREAQPRAVLCRGLLLFLIFLFLPPLIQAISLAEAQERVKPYLEGYKEITPLTKRFGYLGDYYWIFYGGVKATVRVIAAVEDAQGVMLLDKQRLEAIAALVYKIEAINFLREARLSVADLAAFAEVMSTTTERISHNYASFEANIAPKYLMIDFSPLAQSIERLRSESEAFTAAVSLASNAENAFEFAHDDVSLNEFLDAYNKSLESVDKLLLAVDSHRSTLLAKNSEIAERRDLTPQQKKELNEALIQLDTGEEATQFKIARFEPSKRGFQTLITGADAWIKDSVDGFFFIQAKVDAKRGYDELSGEARWIIENEYELLTCAINISEFKADWRSVKGIVESPAASLEDLQFAARRVSELKQKAMDIRDRYARCVTATPRALVPAPVIDVGALISPIIFALIVVIIAYYAYQRWKKAQLEQGEA